MSDIRPHDQHPIDSHKQELLDGYVSFLNHDFRGSMGSMTLMLEVLRRQFAGKPEFAEILADLEILRRSVNESNATLDRYVHAYRLERGIYVPRHTTIHVRHLIDDVLASNRVIAAERNVKFTTQVDESVKIASDREILKLILSTLINNAIVHGPRENENIIIEARPYVPMTNPPDSGDTKFKMSFVIQDDGPGIAPEQFARIFEGTPGVRGKCKLKIGLRICKLAADVLHAKLEIESKDRKGVTAMLLV